MDPSEQAVLINDFMVAVAPVVARYTLETMRLLKDSYRSEETEANIRRYAADAAANITMEFASHMAARFAQLHDAAQPTSAKDSAAPIQEKATAG
jgi:hypothetical protein